MGCAHPSARPTTRPRFYPPYKLRCLGNHSHTFYHYSLFLHACLHRTRTFHIPFYYLPKSTVNSS